MARREEMEEGEQGLPQGWTPEDEHGAQWQGIAALLKSADSPYMPKREAFEDLRLTIRERLEQERLDAPRPVPVTPVREESFTHWLRQIITGGGAGAQAMRLAAVGLLGFFIAQPFAGNSPNPPAPGQQHVANATPPTQPNVANPPTEQTFQQENPPLEIATALDRSGLDSSGRVKSASQTSADLGLHNGTDWYLYSHFGAAPATGGPSIQSVGTQPDDAMALIQKLRFQSLVNNDQASLQAVRQLEDTLGPALVDHQSVTIRQNQALEYLRQAEELAARDFVAQALDSYRAVIETAPGSFLAFLADYQIARLNFETAQDFEQSLKSYRALIEKYPSQYMTPQLRNEVLRRIELLASNYAEDWLAVRLWQQAQHATGTAREELLVELVASVPQSPLAGEAALRLAGSEIIDANALESVIENALNQAGQAPHAASLRYAKAELLQRAGDIDKAEEEYRKVLTIPGAEQFAPRVNLRLQQMK